MAIWVHDRSLEMLNFHPPTRSNRDKIAEQGHISTCSFALNDSTCEHRDFGRRGGSPRTLPAGSREPQGSRGTPPLRSIVISQQVYTSLNERGRSPTTRIILRLTAVRKWITSTGGEQCEREQQLNHGRAAD